MSLMIAIMACIAPYIARQILDWGLICLRFFLQVLVALTVELLCAALCTIIGGIICLLYDMLAYLVWLVP